MSAHDDTTTSAPQPDGLVESLPVLVWFNWRGHIWLRCDVADMLVGKRLLKRCLVGCECSRKAEPQQQDLPAARLPSSADGMPPPQGGEGGGRPSLHRRGGDELSVKMHALDLASQLTCRLRNFLRCRCCTIIVADVEALASHSHSASYRPNLTVALIGQLSKLVLQVEKYHLLALSRRSKLHPLSSLYLPSLGRFHPSHETG